jgi:hypothetical protein
VANPEEANSSARWAIEIVRDDSDQSSEFYSIIGLQIVRDSVQILTAGGTQVTFKAKNLRKLLVMRAKDKTS